MQRTRVVAKARIYKKIISEKGDAVALRVERRTSDREVAGSTLARALQARQP